jgi:hypothetical protein
MPGVAGRPPPDLFVFASIGDSTVSSIRNRSVMIPGRTRAGLYHSWRSPCITKEASNTRAEAADGSNTMDSSVTFRSLLSASFYGPTHGADHLRELPCRSATASRPTGRTGMVRKHGLRCRRCRKSPVSAFRVAITRDAIQWPFLERRDKEVLQRKKRPSARISHGQCAAHCTTQSDSFPFPLLSRADIAQVASLLPPQFG